MKAFEERFNLQFFADGEGAGAGAAETGDAAKAAAGAAGQQSGENVPAAEVDPAAEFEQLISGKFKDQYSAAMSKAVQGRVAKEQSKTKAAQDELGKLSGIRRILSDYYGTDDPAELEQRMTADDYYLSHRADNDGSDFETARQRRMQQWRTEDNEKQLRQLQQEQAERQFFGKMAIAEESIRKTYADFDMGKELTDPTFLYLVRDRGMDPMQVYEMQHHRELQEAAVKRATEEALQKASQAVASGSKRPSENGAGQATGSVAVSSPMTPEAMNEIRAAVNRGEKVGPGHPLYERYIRKGK